MSQGESLSDSDSNTSSSWIFVDDCPSHNRQEKNKCYLNSDGEPGQHLISEYLNSANLELETDSDGISIISESDDIKESTPQQELEPPLIEDIRPVDEIVLPDESVETVSVNPEECNFNKYVIVGWVLIAVATPFLLNFFSARIEEILGNYNDNAGHIIDNVQPEILANKELYKRNKGAVQSPANELTQGVGGASDRRKRYDSKGEIDEHRLDCKDHSSLVPNFNRRTRERVNKDGGEFSEEHSLINHRPQKPFLKHMKKKKEHRRADANLNKMKKDFNSDVLPRKKKYDDEFGKHQKKEKTKRGKENGRENANNVYTKEIKKLRMKLEGRDKDIKALIKLLRAKDKQLKLLEFKILKHLNSLSKSEKNKKDVEYRSKDLQVKSNGTSGEWYHKLHKGRNTIRKQHRASDWVFDRADVRSRKRNLRNNWYWNWMEDREQLRLKRGFWQFTY